MVSLGRHPKSFPAQVRQTGIPTGTVNKKTTTKEKNKGIAVPIAQVLDVEKTR